jgi:hypothetical protein
MKLVEMIKDGLVKITVENCVEQLKKLGWERVGTEAPQAQTPVEQPVAKPKRTRKPKEAL